MSTERLSKKSAVYTHSFSKHIVYIAMSLDGKIARLDGSVDWLSPYDTESEDYGYETFLDSVDAIVMGAHTYAKLSAMESWPYLDKPAFVLTHEPLVFKKDLPVESVFGAPQDVIDALLHRGMHTLWVMGGGDVISSMIRAQQIDELNIFVVPIILGEGIPLFQHPNEHSLQLYSTKQYPSGIVELNYVIHR